jgi:hypothetical protein
VQGSVVTVLLTISSSIGLFASVIPLLLTFISYPVFQKIQSGFCNLKVKTTSYKSPVTLAKSTSLYCVVPFCLTAGEACGVGTISNVNGFNVIV